MSLLSRLSSGFRGIVGLTPRPQSFDAGKNVRRMKSVPTSTVAINSLIRQYGRTVLARSRYLAANNPETVQAKRVYVAALVGTGIKPSSLVQDNPALKKEIQLAWFDWTDESDADGLTDFYGQQTIVAGEMFEAGECFVRLRARRIEDGLTVPFQLQLLPAEMLDLADNRDLGNGNRVEMGIEFDAIGRRVAYHFWRQHPGADRTFGNLAGQKTVVPAEEVLHLFKPVRAGQIRGIPHILSSIIVTAIHDSYNDGELERKRTASLFGAFITSDAPEEDSPLVEGEKQADADGVANGVALEPGATVKLEPGEDVKFAEPADVGGNYEAFQYRNFLARAAGMGVPYADMTGDLRQSSYGSQRGGMITFKRSIEPDQHAIMVFQFCRPIWKRFINDAILVGAITVALAAFQARPRDFLRAKWITPKWDWIDPLKDLMAEVLAVKAGFKARSDVIEAMGDDPEETDARIAADKAREERLGLDFAESQFMNQALSTALQPDPPPAQDNSNGA